MIPPQPCSLRYAPGHKVCWEIYSSSLHGRVNAIPEQLWLELMRFTFDARQGLVPKARPLSKRGNEAQTAPTHAGNIPEIHHIDKRGSSSVCSQHVHRFSLCSSARKCAQDVSAPLTNASVPLIRRPVIDLRVCVAS